MIYLNINIYILDLLYDMDMNINLTMNDPLIHKLINKIKTLCILLFFAPFRNRNFLKFRSQNKPVYVEIPNTILAN